ncbi:hypothetical protein CWO89_38410 [Bradyrhizobium sp. Leo170]|nr:hypothetical protein CWO89_38410 [Bradyrhizobium sp. Leo170]
MAVLPIQLDRARRTPLAAQIYCVIRESIENGRLASGPRLNYRWCIASCQSWYCSRSDGPLPLISITG